jgi:catechol 2,3-dioxygenase-like lactoylglutathione lyase family enzyme
MEILELWHVNIEVSDLQRALAFYRRLGLKEIPRAGTPEREGTWLRFGDGRELHLSVGEPKKPNRSHFAIVVDDLREARQRCQESGATIETAREIPGVSRFFVRDPDGNRIEIAQRT